MAELEGGCESKSRGVEEFLCQALGAVEAVGLAGIGVGAHEDAAGAATDAGCIAADVYSEREAALELRDAEDLPAAEEPTLERQIVDEGVDPPLAKVEAGEPAFGAAVAGVLRA